jgi:hypothetical protein
MSSLTLNRASGSDRTANERLVVGPTAQTIGPSIVAAPMPTVIVRPTPTVIVPAAREMVRVGPVTVVIQRMTPVAVEAPPRPVWDDRGWEATTRGDERVYSGWYRVTNRRRGQPLQFEGRITQRGNVVTPYIADPPPDIRRHPKGPCFTVTQAPWFQIHWRRPAANVDDALLYVERILDEVVNGRR